MPFTESTESIDTYKDYTYIMYIVCDKTASYYSKIKNITNIPIILCSACLSILNTSELDQLKGMDKIILIRNITIAFNLLIAVSIAILNVYQITEKNFFFSKHANNFLKLNNKITTDIAKFKATKQNIEIIYIIYEYNILCEHISFHIPSHIRKIINKEYKNYHLPFLILKTKKTKLAPKTPILSHYYNFLTKRTPSSSSTVVDNSTSNDQWNEQSTDSQFGNRWKNQSTESVFGNRWKEQSTDSVFMNYSQIRSKAKLSRIPSIYCEGHDEPTSSPILKSSEKKALNKVAIPRTPSATDSSNDLKFVRILSA